MVKEQLKPKKGVVVTEINGVKYFKLQSNYTGDYTKNCGLLGTEIDENFYFLRSNDIDKMSVKNGILTLTRVDGGTLSADISMPYTFNFDEKTGKLIITDGNGDVQVLEGFVVEGKDVRVATDATLNGDGTKGNPLRISELEKTGTYAPANEFLDMAVYTYFELVRELLDDGTEIYHYEERMKNQVPEGADVIEYSEKPTKGLNFESPRWIKVRKDINLPDASKLGAGYRIVTRESKDNFGLLYNYDGVKKIQAALDTTGSLWRIPTRRDWALMLNAAEYCEEDRDHDTKYVNEWTGKNAGARAKATTLWMLSNRQEKGLPVAGEDSLPIAGTNKFTVYPVGYADGSRGADDKDFDLEAFTKKSSFWSITPTDCNGEKYSSNIFTRTFAYDTRKVLQESSKPSSRMSIRLVKDFEPGQMNANEIENILGYDMPVVLLTNDETGYSKLWTSINVGFSEEQYDGVYSKEWSAATGSERGHEIVYYINVWDGKEWHKKQMNEGDSIVLLNGGKDESGNTIYNHEWRIYSGETEPMLIDTAKAIKGEFQKEIDELNEKVDDLSDITKELSTVTKETKENLENEINRAKSAETALRKDIDDLSAFTETAEDNVNDLVNDIIGVEGNVVSGFAMPNFYGAYWKDINKSEYDTAPNDEKEHIHGSEIPSAAEWHEEHPSINYIELFDDSVEPHVYKYVKLETDAHYISDAENIIDAIEKLDGAISEAVGDIMVKKLDEPAPDMLASYVLLVGDEQKGDRINIPKDDVQAFHEVKVGHSGATINSETGEIIDGPYADHEVLIISYLNSEHVYKLVEIDLEDIIIENEFKDGFNVEGHEVKVKIDDASEKVIVKYDENENVTEKVLSVSPDGVKVSHIQDAINAAVEKEKIRATAAEISISGAVNTFSGATVNKFTEIDGKIDSSNTSLNELSAATKTAISNLQSELDTTQTGAGLNADGSYVPKSTATYISDVTSLKDADTKLDEELARVEQARKSVTGQDTDKYVPNVSLSESPIAYIADAKSLNDADVKLDKSLQNLANETLKNVVVDGVSGVVTNGIAAVSISADTIPIGPFEEYTGRATTSHPIHNDYSVLEAIKQVNTNSTESIKGVNEKVQTLSKQFETLSDSTDKLSAATDNKFTEIDKKIDDEKTRATAAEESISGTVNTLSSATESAISNVQSELNATQKGAGLKEDGSYKGHDSQSEGMTYITTATSIDNATVLLDKGIQKETNRATEEEKALRGLITDSTTKVSELSAATETFSGATVAEIAKVDGKINDEITRATAAEKSISGDVDTLRDSIKTFSGATVDEIARLDAQSKKNKVKSTGNTIVVTEATEGTNLDVNIDNKTILSDNGKLKTGLKVMPLAPGELEANVREAFRLVDNEGTPVDGTTIKIYKSSSLVSVELISKDDIDYVRITYIDNSGATQTMDLNIQQLIFESEFKDGLVVNENGEVRVKIDPTSEVFLTVSSEGIKVSGLQNAIKTAVAAEVARATAAEDSISANVTTLSSTTETFSASTVAKFEVMESGWNVPGSIKHTIEDAFVKSVAVGSSEDSNKSLMRYYNDGDEHKYYVSSSANDMYYNGLPLSTVIKNIKDEITQSSNDTDELSAATISEVARLDRRINDETTRATAAENSISGTVNTLSAATESEIERIEGKLSDNERVTSEAINQLKDEIDKTQEGAGLNEDGSYHKHNTVGDMANYITNATSLDNADMMLDSALKAESDRAIASEESISGIVNTFSATTESTIKNLQEQLTEANSIIETLRTEIQTLSGVVETIESQMAVNIYSTVRAMLQGASKQIKVTPDDDSKQINIGFADDAIFGQ